MSLFLESKSRLSKLFFQPRGTSVQEQARQPNPFPKAMAATCRKLWQLAAAYSNGVVQCNGLPCMLPLRITADMQGYSMVDDRTTAPTSSSPKPAASASLFLQPCRPRSAKSCQSPRTWDAECWQRSRPTWDLHPTVCPVVLLSPGALQRNWVLLPRRIHRLRLRGYRLVSRRKEPKTAVSGPRHSKAEARS